MGSDTRVYFLASACHVCKSKSTLHRCEICKMVFYCSRKHRRDDWFDHSQLCWALNKIRDGGRVDCLWGLYDGGDFTKFRHEVATRCCELLKRRLKPWELEMIYHPRTCNVCKEFNWENLSPCKDCEFVYTCEKKHFRKNHPKWCKTLKTYQNLIINQTTCDVMPEMEIKIDSHKSMIDVLNQKDDYQIGRILDMVTPIRRGGLWSIRFTWVSNIVFADVDEQNALISEVLTYPLTVLLGLKAIGRLEDRKLGILLIGAETQAEVEPLAKWENYLLHSLPDVELLCLKFLGPELRGRSEEFYGDLCETCRKGQKLLKFHFIPGKFYHEYSPKPNENTNLICAFNSGMYRDVGFESEDSWRETIEMLFARGTPPVIITEYTCRELKMVLKKVKSACKDVVAIHQIATNPFASLRPWLNIISEDESPVIFKNYFYAVLQRK